jgi:hypothetical protein
MGNDRARILDMLKQGKITVDEAEQLLDALDQRPASEPTPSVLAATPSSGNGRKCRFLRVLIKGDGNETVDVRVPMQLLRAGVKLGALMPPDARAKLDTALGEKGMHFDLANLTPETVDEFVEAMSDLSVNIAGDDGETVRVFCE